MSRRGNLRRPMAWLALITIFGAVLRLHGLDTELWLDEITTVIDATTTSAQQLVGSFTFAGRHPLNSLLIRATSALFGTPSWAVRLPAALAGIATIPALYALARCALGARSSLLAALLLSTSYHHIFFSQNARGYTGFLLWSTLGTTFLLHALERDRTRDWLLYFGCLWLATATVALGLFVFAGHALVLLAAWGLRREPVPKTMVGHAVASTALYGVTTLGFYHAAVARIPGYLASTYHAPSEGFALLSQAHLEAWIVGLAPAFGARGPLAVLALLTLPLGLGAIWILLRRQPLWTSMLLAPLVILFAFTAIAGLRPSPRFFLWALPVAALIATALANLAGNALREALLSPSPLRRWAASVPATALATLALAALAALPRYYRTPKQPTRQSVAWLLAQPGVPAQSLIVGAYLAKWGLRYYGPPASLREGQGFTIVHTATELAAAERGRPADALWLVTTFRRALRGAHPDLAQSIEERYRVVMRFPATIADAEIEIWRPIAAADPP